ncbi:MAG: DMT family transporter [Clostridia bacterium]|nr:DMT family transporter [Clostridia bacterium]
MIKNGMLFVLITALCFTTHEPVSKLIANQVNPYALTAIRFLIGSLALLPLSIGEIVKKKIKLTAKDFGVMTALGILFICISMVLLQVAVKVADSPALIAIIFSSNSIMTIAMSAIFLNVKLTGSKIIGIILCVIGVLVSADITAGSNTLSVVLALLAAITFSTYTILCKKYMTKISGVIQSGISFFIGSVILIAVLYVCGIEIWGGVSPSNIGEVLYISVIVTGLGYWAYFGAMKNGGAQTAALAFLIKPILTPFATFFINGIVPDSNIIVAVILVVIGAAMASGTLQNLKGGLKR